MRKMGSVEAERASISTRSPKDVVVLVSSGRPSSSAAAVRDSDGLGWTSELQNPLDEVIDWTGNWIISHERNGIEKARHLIEVMGGNDHGAAVFLSQHLIKELPALCIEAEIGFVEKLSLIHI